MDPVLKMYFEQKASPTEIIAAGHDAELVISVLNKVEHPANEFKRQQLPADADHFQERHRRRAPTADHA